MREQKEWPMNPGSIETDQNLSCLQGLLGIPKAYS